MFHAVTEPLPLLVALRMHHLQSMNRTDDIMNRSNSDLITILFSISMLEILCNLNYSLFDN